MRAAFAATAALLASAAVAQTAPDPLDGPAIRGLVAGNTVTGSMTDSGRYTEFYGEDGTIRGEGYTGTWTIEGDEMCFAYGEAPSCFSVGREGDQVLWITDAGVVGTGTVLDGNPNAY